MGSLSHAFRRFTRAVASSAAGQVAIGYALAAVDPWIGSRPRQWIMDYIIRCGR